MIKNNVTRLLDGHRVPYQAFELPVGKLGAVEAAQYLQVPPEQIFKTIVITREGRGKPLLALVPGPREVDLKALAKTLGEKKVFLPSEREAERLTGLQAGGISPLALINRGFQVVLDQSAEAFEEIYISAGQRGLNVRLPTAALVELTHARIVTIAGEPPA